MRRPSLILAALCCLLVLAGGPSGPVGRAATIQLTATLPRPTHANYQPLVQHQLATATAEPTATVPTAQPTSTTTPSATATSTATPSATATGTPPQTFAITGQVFLKPRWAVWDTVCYPYTSPTWIGQIDATHTATLPPPYTLPEGIFGYGYISTDTGEPVAQVPIAHDPVSGTLRLSAQGFTPGIYRLMAYVGYKGEDGASRVYDQLTKAFSTVVPYVQFELSANNASPIMIEPLFLKLRNDAALCP